MGSSSTTVVSVQQLASLGKKNVFFTCSMLGTMFLGRNNLHSTYERRHGRDGMSCLESADMSKVGPSGRRRRRRRGKQERKHHSDHSHSSVNRAQTYS